MSQRLAFFVAAACVVLIGGAVIYSQWPYRMVPYVPVVEEWVAGEPELRESPELLTPAHLERMQTFLRIYREPFRLRDDSMFVQKRLRDDRELLWNYTSKAENPAWVKRYAQRGKAPAE
jgi:hypothetical protein